jgi:hypothetical protein
MPSCDSALQFCRVSIFLMLLSHSIKSKHVVIHCNQMILVWLLNVTFSQHQVAKVHVMRLGRNYNSSGKDKSTNPLKSLHRQLFKLIVLRSFIHLCVLYVEDHSIGMMMFKGRLMKLECF